MAIKLSEVRELEHRLGRNMEIKAVCGSVFLCEVCELFKNARGCGKILTTSVASSPECFIATLRSGKCVHLGREEYQRLIREGRRKMYTPSISELASELEKYDALPLECDGMVRIIHMALNQMNVVHRVKMTWIGALRGAIPHLWIDVETTDGLATIDYRRRMWFGRESEHGVFPKDDAFAGEQLVMLDPAGCWAVAVTVGLENLLLPLRGKVVERV